ncbi:MAG TPA: 5-(carboxyamino)imidazole ribonucleotide synthase [Cyclobacteriaceae bacterium]|nr:5-(carboxyamino)imidazole ribonucleotide synthase [Cyclobacteriaceae bacterium]HMV07818.1 5-(carboxyamino)imidazole ribonucleotide synthase [Cyclobacteriaceae bacterium]HMV88086.1 5-(carboxyamino)imidazole ribonucleotide synthase [Cyclobacteriaceae bacterium]HMW98952.1 5-(carboxyamino)imidazole ribonucleotide synthase [Cyclobacteriaceae bacterium]HMX48414.1 5-(carboxyamino)imidazole ribonucleotide synthase [Cyclobacteriaceae bacterium]
MANTFNQDFKLGILGGGQLGRMLIQSGIDFNFNFSVLDPDKNAPCSSLAPFSEGKLTDYDTVMKFGELCDIITIEIENVNTSALKELVRKGKKVFPQPEVIELIQDKRVQKTFYKSNGISTAYFVLTENKDDVARHVRYPMVNKLGKEGYDGRGVQILRGAGDLQHAFDKPGLLEELVPFEKEISVIVARNTHGQVDTFPAVEMVFHPTQNLVEYLFAPAQISTDVAQRADAIARSIIEKLNMVGLLAVEMFVTASGEVLVNEIAPRPHNSGHQTIEANVTSQYEQHLRAITGLPLGKTDLIMPSAMVNLLGEPGFSGPARYAGFEEVMNVKGVHVHLYGKNQTKPFRKMGHVTILDDDIDSLKKKANFVKQTLKVIA